MAKPKFTFFTENAPSLYIEKMYVLSCNLLAKLSYHKMREITRLKTKMCQNVSFDTEIWRKSGD